MNIIVLGHAGSGKSTLVREFGNFLDSYTDNSVGRVNLDTATPPEYKADIDSRNIVKAEELMSEYGLGINGALLKSVEILKENVDKLILRNDFVLYDTPGQLELFLYTDFGEFFSRKLMESDPTTAVFLVDSQLCRNPENYLSAITQSAVIALRTGVDTITVFNKADLSEPPDYEEVVEYIRRGEGTLPELMKNFLPFYEVTSLRFRTIKISAKMRSGFDELLDVLNEIFCSCGDIS